MVYLLETLSIERGGHIGSKNISFAYDGIITLVILLSLIYKEIEHETYLLTHLFFTIIAAPSYASTTVNESFVDTEGARLFCRTLGEGKPLIIIHGGPGLTQDYLLPQMYTLAENNFVIFYDQRGCGQSTGEISEETINLQTFTRDIDSIRRAFNCETVSLLGHSWGGFLAMEYATSHPDSVDKLILSNSTPSTSEDQLLFLNEWLRRMEPYQNELASLHEAPGYEEGDPDVIECLHRLIFRTYCYDPEKADLLNARLESKAAVNGAQVNKILRQNVLIKPFNLQPALRNLKMPTLVIHGDFDPIPCSVAESIHECIEGSEFILLKNCGHFPYVEVPEDYFKSLKCFLSTSSESEST